MLELTDIFPIHTKSPSGDGEAHYAVTPEPRLCRVNLDSVHLYNSDEQPYVECAALSPADARTLSAHLIRAAQIVENDWLPPVAEALYRQAVRQLGDF